MTWNFENDDTPNHHIQTATKICYILYIVFSMLVCIWILPRTCKKLYKELKQELIDIFKIGQLLFIVLYLITRNLFCFILFIPNVGFYYIPALSIPVFFFYYYEIINNLCWVCFIIHIKTCKPNLMRKEIKKKTLCTERILLIATGFLMVASLLIITSILICSLAFRCSKLNLYTSDKSDDDDEACLFIHGLSVNFMTFMFSIGAFSAVLKILIGMYLLRTMRKELYIPYQKVKYKIIVTMVCTICIMCINAIFNFCLPSNIPYTQFTIMYAANIHEKHSGYIVFLAFSEYLVYAFEVFLLCFTTDNIDYSKYITYLTVGIRRSGFIVNISLFLVYFPNKSSESNENEDEIADYTYLDKSEDKNFKNKLITYNEESRTISQFSGDFSSKDTHNFSSRTSYLPYQSTMNRVATDGFTTDE